MLSSIYDDVPIQEQRLKLWERNDMIGLKHHSFAPLFDIAAVAD
jgi:hypothetical protein